MAKPHSVKFWYSVFIPRNAYSVFSEEIKMFRDISGATFIHFHQTMT